MRLRNWKSNSDWTYRADVRGMITKMPGFSFSGYKTGLLLLGIYGLVSENQYQQMIDDYSSEFDGRMDYFYN